MEREEEEKPADQVVILLGGIGAIIIVQKSGVGVSRAVTLEIGVVKGILPFPTELARRGVVGVVIVEEVPGTSGKGKRPHEEAQESVPDGGSDPFSSFGEVGA